MKVIEENIEKADDVQWSLCNLFPCRTLRIICTNHVAHNSKPHIISCKYDFLSLFFFHRFSNPGLKHVLQHHGASRKEVYKRIFQVLWFGNGLRKQEDGKIPTYVYPKEIRQIVRKRFQDAEAGKNYEDFDNREGVCHLSLDEVLSAKWPEIPNACEKCKKEKGKPYWIVQHNCVIDCTNRLQGCLNIAG